jgi:sec-independent protein translocase protein TatB
MLDFGWAELLLIMAVAIFVIGPKEIPQIMFSFGRVVRRLQYMRYALTQQFDDFMATADLNEMRAEAEKRNDVPQTDEKDADSDVDHLEMMLRPKEEDEHEPK